MESRIAKNEADIKALFKKSDFMIDRFNSIEELQKELYKLTTSVGKLATSMEYQVDELKELSSRVCKMEQVPANRWENIIKQVITVVVSAVIGYLLRK